MNGLEQRIVGVLECLDEAGNVALGPDGNIPLAGNPHATISQRLGQMLIYGTPEQKEIAHQCDVLLTGIENKIFGIPTASHCLDAIKDFPKSLPAAG
jgi:hypothetical protein